MADESTFGKPAEGLQGLFSVGAEGLIDEDKDNAPSLEALDLMIEKPGSEIGGYRLLRILGEGGMGIVYLAQQEEPVRRQVALKVIKPGMDSKRVIARFEAEKQALALMQHPHIAGVYDAGLTPTGRPYFVMEYVEGLPVTDYCDQHKLTIKERLNLFVQICQAVQHAHQKGIIHRDIKPSNILVSVENDRAIPKIIDFGIAKAISRPLTDRTIFTEDSYLLGTPEYMSPEQADMATEDIDTRSDVYSLGVLLYILLTGILPFDIPSFRDSGIENIRKTIRETDPKTPSTSLTSLGQEAAEVAEKRSTEISTLTKHLRKELEWIPLKAMQKERSERYSSASELADDVANYLSGVPLIAGPPAAVYRFKKYVRRHRSLVSGIAAVLVVLIAGIVVSTIFAIKAQRQAQGLVSFVDFLTLDVLGSARDITRRDATVIDLIDAATKKLDAGEFKDQPLAAESLLRFRLGNLLKALGYSNKAVPHLERVRDIYLEHGITAPSTGASHDGSSLHLIMNYLALAYRSSGEYKKAETLWRQIIKEKDETNHIYTNLYPWVKLVLAHVCRLKAQYDESERILLEMMDPQFRNGEGLPPNYMVRCMRSLVETYRGQGRYRDAEQMCIKVEEMGELVGSGLRAKLCLDTGRYSQAEELLRTEIERILRKRPGKDRGMDAKNDLAVVLTRQEAFGEAERLFTEILKVRKEKYSDDDPDTLTAINNFGVLRREQGLHEEAVSLLRQALEGRQQKLGLDHPACFESMHELAVLYIRQTRCEDAEPLLLGAFDGRETRLGPEHPRTLDSLKQLVSLYESWPKPEEAEKCRAKLLQMEALQE